MKDIFMLIRRFIAPYYKGYLSLAVLFNILSALLNLVAFALVMPILNILFQIEERVTTYIPFSSLDLTTQAGWSQMKEVVTNNFGYFVSPAYRDRGSLLHTHHPRYLSGADDAPEGRCYLPRGLLPRAYPYGGRP